MLHYFFSEHLLFTACNSHLKLGYSSSTHSRHPFKVADSPDGRLMRFPSLSLRRERLNLPFLFFTLGLSLLSWKIRMLSSLSRTLISRSASCCSRRFSSSSWDFCCRAARVNSSSLERSSLKNQVLWCKYGYICKLSSLIINFLCTVLQTIPSFWVRQFHKVSFHHISCHPYYLWVVICPSHRDDKQPFNVRAENWHVNATDN